jgi:hypothetical protein
LAKTNDFSNCRYNINQLRQTDRCVDKYPDLGAYRHIFDKKDLPKGLDSDLVLRFLILTYTSSSPFVKDYPTDLDTRKTKAMEYLGYDKEDKLTPVLRDMCLLKQVGVAARWMFFLRIQANEDWTFLVAAQERYTSIIKEFIEVSKKKDKEGLSTEIDAGEEKKKNDMIKGLRDQIKEGLEKFMAGEKSKVKEELISFALTAESSNIMPEQYIPIWAERNKLPYDLAVTGL